MEGERDAIVGVNLKKKITNHRPKLSTLGGRIRWLRLVRCGKSQAGWAKDIRTSERSLMHWENDKHKPPMAKVVLMARHGKVTTDWLLTGRGWVE